MVNFFPLLFILFWSSAFISGKIITVDATPFAGLSFRFSFVIIGFLIYAYFKKDKIIIPLKNFFESFSTGILFHGVYLGGCWYAFSLDLPSAIVALIVTFQPILTNILSGPLFNEKIYWHQWVGVSLGFIGSIIVLGVDFNNQYPIAGILSCFAALAGITIGTLWQKKLSGNIPLSVNNAYQALGGCTFNLLLMLLFENPIINFTTNFILAITHQILFISFGAFAILMYLIKNRSVSKTSTLFFLVPPVSAVMAFLFIDESLTRYDIIGLLIATLGVYIATRK
tara:strand:- start:4406 stop:5254 length:849 start_codon:yes stop_codon:yes gene_type:complete